MVVIVTPLGVYTRLVSILTALCATTACDTESAETLLYGKQCELGNCARGFLCHPASQRCVTLADAAKLQAAGDWSPETDSTAFPGGATGGTTATDSPEPLPSGVATARADAGSSAGDPPAMSDTDGTELNPATGARRDRLLPCGWSSPEVCTGEQVCCVRNEETDSCIAPGAPCDCVDGNCDVAHCSKAADCGAGHVCCALTGFRTGGTRCMPAADCNGAELCDSAGNDCTDECNYEDFLRQDCFGDGN